MKVAEIDFPQPIITALSDNRLVVFAGAGVSKNSPANLPSFSELAEKIAQHTGNTKLDDESEDRFLGRLQHKGVKVHEKAVEVLNERDPKPTTLHNNLLRLYTAADKVRIVTTNFDLLFEQAAEPIFKEATPEVFRAPALPSGESFQGIVYVHGAITHPNEIVLTDADFGRGYLTKGWARRFLVDLFQNYTVLFVGYSHNDTIMNYLARALPPNNTSRYALIKEKEKLEHWEEELKHWQELGITPIEYSDHPALDASIEKFAEIMGRGYLEWQREIASIAAKPPPLLNEESIDNIKHVLEDKDKIHFFTKAARLPEWFGWLDENKYLDNLFKVGELKDEDRKLAEKLAEWLADHFMVQHANDLFSLIFKHNCQLNPDFWWRLGWRLGQGIGVKKQGSLDAETLARWISLLLDTIPDIRNDSFISAISNILTSVGERCIKYNLLDSLMQIFYALTKSYLKTPYPSLNYIDLSLVGEHHGLKKLWEEGLKLHLSDVAQPLVELATIRLAEQYFILYPWKQESLKEYILSDRRAKIECYEPTGIPIANDILIDAARDCLDQLMMDQKERALQWCVVHIKSEVPLLRRLAVHTFSGCEELTANQKINWFSAHTNLHDLPIRHEIFRAVRLAYIEADVEHRKKIIDAILAYRWPKKKDPDKESHTAYQHFYWLIRLKEKIPSCKLLQHNLDNIKEQYPNFKKRENLALLSKTARKAGWKSDDDRPSPWTVDELLAKSPDKWLPELSPQVYDVYKARCTVQEAIKKRFEWGEGLASALAKAKKWDERIWSDLIRAWSETQLDEAQCRRVLQWLGTTELYPYHARDIADALYKLVKDTDQPYISTLLPQANKIAAKLWCDIVKRNEPPEKNYSWFSRAINHPAGTLTQFWLFSLSLYNKQKDPKPNTFNSEYRQIFSDIINESTPTGILGRSILASQFSFLLATDEKWTKENLLPLFNKDADTEDFQAVWDGFLGQDILNPAIAELFKEIFIQAIYKIDNMSDNKQEFINMYTAMLIYVVADPLEQWIPKIFRCGDEEIRTLFVLSIEIYLREMNDEPQQELWKRWLKRYWENRLQNIPAKLEASEIKLMLLWLPCLNSIFPEAVELAIQMPPASLERFHVKSIFGKDELLKNYPEALAKLLIYLGKWKDSQMAWHGGQELIEKLLNSDIPSPLKAKLKNLSAKLDL